jgi:hypothetical protein
VSGAKVPAKKNPQPQATSEGDEVPPPTKKQVVQPVKKNLPTAQLQKKTKEPTEDSDSEPELPPVKNTQPAKKTTPVQQSQKQKKP